jgi:homoserine kinase
MFRLGLSAAEVVRFAGMGEEAASGTAHYDNVAASLLGGFVLRRGERDFVRMEAPRSMAACLVTPRLRVPENKTEYARSLLPRSVPFTRAVAVAAAAGMLVHGFAVGSIEEIGRAMNQSLADDPRSAMIPGFGAVRRAAGSSGAAGVCISGAGPTLLAVCENRSSKRVLRSMLRAFGMKGVRSEGFVTHAGGGCRVVEG